MGQDGSRRACFRPSLRSIDIDQPLNTTAKHLLRAYHVNLVGNDSVLLQWQAREQAAFFSRQNADLSIKPILSLFPTQAFNRCCFMAHAKQQQPHASLRDSLQLYSYNLLPASPSYARKTPRLKICQVG